MADGAVWCQQFYAYHLPNAIRVLDFPHAAEHLSRAAQAAFGLGTAAETWSATQRARLLAGQADAVCQAITELPVTQAPDPSQAYQTMRQVASYLQDRLPQVAGMPAGERESLTAYLLPDPPTTARIREATGLAIGSPAFQWY